MKIEYGSLYTSCVIVVTDIKFPTIIIKMGCCNTIESKTGLSRNITRNSILVETSRENVH